MNTLFRRMAQSIPFFLPVLCLAGSPKIAADLTGIDPHSVVNVVVQFTAPPAAQNRARIAELGGVEKADLSLIKGALYSLPAGALEALANNPNVRYISPDRRVEATLDYANPTVGAQMALSYGWDGTGVGVAIIDSGILQENDLLDKTAKTSNVSRIFYSQSFVPRVTSTADQFGHGTHVAGIVAGNATGSTGSTYFKTFRGMAPNAKLINLRVLDSNGAGTDSSVINAINAAIQLKTKAYIGAVLAVGAAALGRGLFLRSSWDLPRFICYLVLAVVASGLKVNLPGVTGTISVLSIFLLGAITELNQQEALVIGVTCILVQCYWHAKVRPRGVQIAFSVANIAFALTATDYAYHLAMIAVLQSPFRLAIAASTFFITNTFPIAVVIALTEHKSLREVWSTCYLWCFPYYLVGAAIVGVFDFANRTLDWQAAVLIVPVVYVIYRVLSAIPAANCKRSGKRRKRSGYTPRRWLPCMRIQWWP